MAKPCSWILLVTFSGVATHAAFGQIPPATEATPVVQENDLPALPLPAPTLIPPEAMLLKQVRDKLNALADEVEAELEKIGKNANSTESIVADIQEEQRTIFREAQNRFHESLRQRPTRATRAVERAAYQQMWLAGARINELQRQLQMAASAPYQMKRNQDLMRRMSTWQTTLSPKERPIFLRYPELRNRHHELMQRVFTAAQTRPRREQTLPTDMTADLALDDRSLRDRAVVDYAHAQQGPLQQAQYELKRLLNLQWDNERLQIDAEAWNAVGGGMTPQDLENDALELMGKRGAVLDTNPINRYNGSRSNHATTLFQFIMARFNTNDVRTGFDGRTITHRFSSNEAAVDLNVSDQDLSFQFHERVGPRRILQVEYRADHSLTINVYGDVVFRLKQDAAGNVVVFEVVDATIEQREAVSFAALYKADPEFVEQRVYPTLDHMGVRLPASRFARDLIYQVVDQLAPATGGELQQRVDQAIIDLDNEQYDRRQAALRFLESHLELASPTLKAVAEGESLSFEQQQQIERLLAEPPSDGPQYEHLVAALGLSVDATYLAQIVPSLNDEDAAIVKTQVAKLKAAGEASQ